MKLNQRLAGLGAALAFSVLARAAHAGDIPSFVETRAGWRSSDITVVDRHGAPLQQVRVDHTVRRLRWVALSDVSPALTRALLDTEDKRFYEHSGVDWQALGSAAIGNSTAKNVAQRGASTLTMQLAGLLDPALKPTQARRNVGQKWDQIRAAQHIERSWKKSEILEAYVNLVTFRGELQGIDALARGLFAKAPHGLNAREAALAAALIRAPNASAGQVSQRACWVLQGQALAAECNGLASYTELVLGRAYVAKLSHNDAPHYARNLLAQSPAVDANTVRSTLDAPLQRAARLALKRHLLELSGRNVEDGAVVVLDNETGESLAWIGSSGDLSRAAQVDGVMALRQAGSTLKPFLYAQAISERRINAATLLDDAPIELATANGLYIPRNYSTQFRGVVTVRNALAGSLNIPAVRTLVMTGVEPFAQTLRGVGLSSIAQAGDYSGYRLALGSADVTL